MPPQVLEGFVLSYGEAMRKKLLKEPRPDRFPSGFHHLHDFLCVIGVRWHGNVPPKKKRNAGFSAVYLVQNI
jgi:hypothetical protein